jgi:hypothetical protein
MIHGVIVRSSCVELIWFQKNRILVEGGAI